MNLLRYLDKKSTYKAQLGYLKSYFIIGMPFGVLFVQFIEIIGTSWVEYCENFEIFRIIYLVFFNIFFISPLIFNYFKYEKKYKKILEKLDSREETNSKDKNHFVKAIFDFMSYKKGETYELKPDYDWIRPLKTGFSVSNSNYEKINLMDGVNKFELVDNLKTKRKKKLKKLSKILK